MTIRETTKVLQSGEERSSTPPVRVMHVRTSNKKFSHEYFIDEEGKTHEVPKRAKE
jgi:hypothetical protein